MKSSKIEPHKGNVSWKCETFAELYFEDTGTVPSRGKSARISYPSFLPEKFGQEFMLPNKKFEAGGGKEWRKSDGRELQ